MKCKRILMRLVTLLLVPAVLVSMMVAPASAANMVEGEVRFTFGIGNASSVFSNLVSGSLVVPSSTLQYPASDNVLGSDYSSIAFMPYMIDFPDVTFYSDVGAYISFYFYVNASVFSSISGPNASGTPATFSYTSGTGKTGYGILDIETWTPSISSGFLASKGWTVKGNTVGTPDDPVRFMRFHFSNASHVLGSAVPSSQGLVQIFSCVTSVSLVGTESSEDLAALESIADSITAQTEIMSAMYADIMSVCNAIYERLGDMQEVQELANQYLVAIGDRLSSIDVTTGNIYSLLSTYLRYLQQIAETADDIYAELAAFHTDFMSMMDLLIGTIQTESDDIQAKMEEIYNLLIAYLDNVFSSAVDPDQEQLVTDTDNVMQDSENITQDFIGDMNQSWDDLDLDSFAFGAQFLSAFVWISSWFTNIFNSLGDYRQIVLFPLYLGVVLLLIGRISRSVKPSSLSDSDSS